MNSYPAPALAIVKDMTLAAHELPAKAIAFQGAPGANSHLAALEYDADCLPLPCFSFEDAIDAVQEGTAECAIIPIENSLHGRVADIHFLLPESGLSIIAEHFMSIRHCLMAKSADAVIKTAMSHPQALGQCRHFLRANGIIPVAYADTAAAAAFALHQRILAQARLRSLQMRPLELHFHSLLLLHRIEQEGTLRPAHLPVVVDN
jgi:prephenate dehydratase